MLSTQARLRIFKGVLKRTDVEIAAREKANEDFTKWDDELLKTFRQQWSMQIKQDDQAIGKKIDELKLYADHRVMLADKVTAIDDELAGRKQSGSQAGLGDLPLDVLVSALITIKMNIGDNPRAIYNILGRRNIELLEAEIARRNDRSI